MLNKGAWLFIFGIIFLFLLGSPLLSVTWLGQAQSQQSNELKSEVNIPADLEKNNSVPALVMPPVSGDFVYDPTGKRDPFKPYKNFFKTDKNINNLKSTEVVEPLQRWELDKFKVVAILWDVKSPRAMVRDPDGKLYTVIKSTKIGRNSGYISQIREGEIVVVESLIAEEGVVRKEVRTLELSK